MHFLRVAYNPEEKLCMSRLLTILSCRLSAEHVANTRTGIKNLVNDVVRKIRITVMMQGAFVSACWGGATSVAVKEEKSAELKRSTLRCDYEYLKSVSLSDSECGHR